MKPKAITTLCLAAILLAATAASGGGKMKGKPLSGMRGGPAEEDVKKKDFYPFIDRYGQYIHDDWPGKIHSGSDFADRLKAEKKDLSNHPGAANLNRFGGWENGPKLKATGHFYTKKYEGKWWLVDPSGRLFFSHGIDCVRFNVHTIIEGRKKWFEHLPPRDGPFGGFYSHSGYVRRGPYAGGHPLCYDFGSANLLRKFGRECRDKSAALAHVRLRSWGLNTIGNWSNQYIYRMRKTPYVVTVSTGACMRIEGSEGYWKKFPDVFDKQFVAKAYKAAASAAGESARDPWCIGYFVDNEFSWGDEEFLAAAALKSPADQPSKAVFIKTLRDKYGQVAKLNAAWGAEYESWSAMLKSRKGPPKSKASRADLVDFTRKIAERYFKTCRDALRKTSPKKLYLGCRFAWVNPVAAAAAQYCDVVSFNRYRKDVSNFKFPADADVPIIIGEFHFGALDRGLFHTGLRAAENQNARAEAYKNYVRSVLEHPNLIGCHWFKYKDQATTGRPLDGENYQIGFLDIADTPYPKIIQAARQIGREMYKYRMGK